MEDTVLLVMPFQNNGFPRLAGLEHHLKVKLKKLIGGVNSLSLDTALAHYG